MSALKILIRGTVQGVGFRPTVFRVAVSLGLRGYVLNKGSNVEIWVEGEKASEFIDALLDALPPIARVDEIMASEVAERHYKDFKIVSSGEGERTSFTPPDTAICEDCLRELFDPSDRRYLYPFINCAVCGARFSLIENVPYDRERTAMRYFDMCDECRHEYENPADRRFHAETTSCPKCGPKYTLYDEKGEILEEREPIKAFASLIDEGCVGIAKSWGGMHVICNLESIKRLREMYKRPYKPFAVMFRDLKAVQEYAIMDEEEEKMLTSPQRPIVLLSKRHLRHLDPILEDISPGLGNIGAYLPYSGFHHVFFHFSQEDAVVMTSANIPGEPMVIRNEDAFSLKADCFLLHNLEIVNRVDDSVVRLYKGRRFFLRKSRGFVPNAIKVGYKSNILSLGAGENVSVCISKGGNLYQSQYIGNSFYYGTMRFLEDSINRLMSFLGMRMEEIDAIAVDLHPRYPTRMYGKELSSQFGIELIEIQHHWAHSAALMLDNCVEEAVVLTLDGTGYGTDGTAWGGEVLKSSFYDFERVCSLEALPLLGGDAAIKDPRRLVFAIFTLLGRDAPYFEREKDILAAMLNKSPKTSSFGRVLDALSCFLGICERMTYDGEPAMKLEKYLERGLELAKSGKEYEFNTEVRQLQGRKVVRTLPLFEQLAELCERGLLRSEREKAAISFSFVKAILEEMVEIASEHASQHIGITGGVSYDVPIVSIVENATQRRGLRLLTHNSIPNGDGGISAGQNVIAAHLLSAARKKVK